MILLPFEPAHAEEMSDYGGQVLELDDGDLELLQASGPGFSGFIDGELVGCAGVHIVHEYRGIAWCMLRSRFRRNFLAIHRAVHRFLWQECKTVRVEAHVDVDYEQGHRWALALGFIPEGPVMPFYLPGGRDAQQYVRLMEAADGGRRSIGSGRGRRDRGNSAVPGSGSSSKIQR